LQPHIIGIYYKSSQKSLFANIFVGGKIEIVGIHEYASATILNQNPIIELAYKVLFRKIRFYILLGLNVLVLNC
jgi:hypothetical protein